MILPGFYGKMPATGDFVTRRLPGDFVRIWDRWLAQHIVPLIGLESWPRTTALRFLAGPASFSASTGIILQSADRVGRQFPLSVVAQLAKAPVQLARADAWFARIEEAAFAAQQGELTPDELDAALATLPVPPVEPGSEIISDMVMWTSHSDIFDIDPLSPQATLEQVFSGRWKTGLI
ncbi:MULTISPECIES: type VI secretion system-associated protein TagF [unclassified Mesorhizobium]|uniref:type VI secretion system-associated protein TagF n=1 Tax=unclassified Mesorhizobium TaxID=325217 RepID=UPI0007EC463C|nr:MULTISPECIES: type VI secretion system-associated protein TagF [unclassified Mesorhizobium]RWB35769.1 MAG: type VI secretion system-associated protein TagF [Mesorhizobium sp.]RWC21404.1 MAG: type VI secretion system-associated protein TagF [Mesorhizobium sp.]RWD45109.1 MAG: type VI secretion system-associated protein TagF [Mesorhizobium sp.]RWE97580.1 MAG: type VI secretion system-associated protein TagF [Mesorhizobium sp.]TGT95449.1 type VI secretion system-associated protein TagF [Mesorhi